MVNPPGGKGRLPQPDYEFKFRMRSNADFQDFYQYRDTPKLESDR